MKTEISLLIAKQRAGNKLSGTEIITLMNYALELLKEFGRITELGIAKIRKLNYF